MILDERKIQTKQMIFEFVLGICESKPSYFRKQLQITTNFTSLLLQMMTQIQDNPKWNLGEVSFLPLISFHPFNNNNNNF